MRKIISLENLIYLTVFALPAYLLRFNFLGVSTNVLDCLMGLSILSWLITYRRKIDCGVILKRRLLVFSVGLLFFGIFISVLLNKNYAVGAGIIKSWFLLPGLFCLAIRGVVEKKKRRNVFGVYYVSAFFVALVSLGYYFFGTLTYDLRLQGFFNSPNYLAMYLAPAIFIGYGLFPEAKAKKRRLIIVSGAVIIWALYLTYSYASWLAIFGSFVLIFVIEKKIDWKRGLVGLLLLVALFFSQVGKNKFSDLVGIDNRSSFSSRAMIWQSAERILGDSWLWGIGAGNFQEKYLEYQKYFPPYLEWAVPHPHNLYLAFWLYGGIFGLVGFLALIYVWFLAIVRSQKNPELKFIALGIMFYVLLHGLVDTTYFKNDLAVVFWLLFVLL
jgi:O-antigen ligase